MQEWRPNLGDKARFAIMELCDEIERLRREKHEYEIVLNNIACWVIDKERLEEDTALIYLKDSIEWFQKLAGNVLDKYDAK